MKTPFATMLGFVALASASASDKNPVTKVVNLLKDMADQLEKEGEEDEEIYDEMNCWCKTNDREKTTAISNAEGHIADLTTSIEALTSQSSRLTVEIENHKKDLAKATKALDEATALREKELDGFTDEEKDLLQSIKALDSAIVVLSKHHTSLIQDPSAISNAASIASREFTAHSGLLEGTITLRQRALVSAAATSFAQEPELSNAQTHVALRQALRNTNPASGEIFGILKQMKETFETNLAATQKDEAKKQEFYENLKAAKGEEIAATKGAIEEKTVTLADADEKLAQAKEDLEDTRNGLTADEAFLLDLKQRCSSMDAEWETRQKMRQEEIVGVQEAIAILTSDEAHASFGKMGFLQLKQNKHKSARRTAAAKILAQAAAVTGSMQLMNLASSAQLDAFVEVKKAIDDMVVELQAAKAADVKQKDSCINQLNENTRFTEKSSRDQSDLQSNMDGLTATIEELAAAVQGLEGEIAEMQVQVKRAGEDREKENVEFQTTIQDQRMAQKLLSKALEVLKSIYAKKEKSLVQIGAHSQSQQEPAGPPPPPGFGEYKKAGGAGGVVGMIEQIIGESKHVEQMAIKDEQNAQEQYESFVKETNNAIEEKREAIVNKNQDKADAEQSLTAAKDDHASVTEELNTLAAGALALHQGCDFLLKNFEIRQDGFDQEVEALQQAKAILSGMATDF